MPSLFVKPVLLIAQVVQLFVNQAMEGRSVELSYVRMGNGRVISLVVRFVRMDFIKMSIVLVVVSLAPLVQPPQPPNHPPKSKIMMNFKIVLSVLMVFLALGPTCVTQIVILSLLNQVIVLIVPMESLIIVHVLQNVVQALV
eukprot:Lithocolla_globosa_v1_NODE_111_length_6228_cov_60.322858.p3 type:complete len:142 gc:universal NODE_111_length_6228_cov_60.322858:3611-4036(+)